MRRDSAESASFLMLIRACELILSAHVKIANKGNVAGFGSSVFAVLLRSLEVPFRKSFATEKVETRKVTWACAKGGDVEVRDGLSEGEDGRRARRRIFS